MCWGTGSGGSATPLRAKEKAPRSRGVTRGPKNAHRRRLRAGEGTRSGRKAGDVHRPLHVTAEPPFEFHGTPPFRFDRSRAAMRVAG
jgi:hypothetical protein